jgi:hypothetical protein
MNYSVSCVAVGDDHASRDSGYRETEHYFLLFAALMQSLRTPNFNIRLVT